MQDWAKTARHASKPEADTQRRTLKTPRMKL